MRFASMAALALLAACQGGDSARDDAAVPDTQPNVAAEGNSGTGPPESAEAGGDQQWFRRQRADGDWAGYGPPFSEAAFSVRCETGANRLIFNTTEMPPSGAGPTQMRLSAAGVDQSIPAEAREDGLPHTDAPVPADAPWLPRLASASGDLTVRVGASDPLAVPISEPLRSLIRDCAP